VLIGRCDGVKPKCRNCDRRGEEICEYDAVLRRRGPGKNNKKDREMAQLRAKQIKRNGQAASCRALKKRAYADHALDDELGIGQRGLLGTHEDVGSLGSRFVVSTARE
jgi:hypothetical protein